MKRPVTTLILCFFLSGCAHLPWGDDKGPSPYEQKRKLAEAVDLVKAGKTSSATKILVALSRERGVPGVTDEALFRLGLLTLRTGSDNETAQATLERLQREYPTSQWTRTAAPLLDVLGQYEELRHQNRSLRSTNQNLSKENKELIQNIERLKSLDLELERKPKPGR